VTFWNFKPTVLTTPLEITCLLRPMELLREADAVLGYGRKMPSWYGGEFWNFQSSPPPLELAALGKQLSDREGQI